MFPLTAPDSVAAPIVRAARQPGVIALLTALAVLAFLLWPRPGPEFPYTPDSADYIEEARSLLRGENALVTSSELGKAAESSRLFPIGFPVVLAALGAMGIDPSAGALVVNGGAAILIPLLLLYFFTPVLSGPAMAVVIVVSALTPGLLINARLGLSDTFSLVLCIAAVGILARRSDRSGFVLAGLFSAAAYAVRNAHLALIAAYGAYFVLELIAGRQSRRKLLGQAAWFTAGACTIVLPLALRNVLTFGQINPYEMPPSTIGFVVNARTFAASLLEDLTTSFTLAKYLAWTPAGALICALLLGAIAVWIARRLPSLGQMERRVTLVCLLFATLGAAVVVVARSRYQWGELIGLRHTFPYVPFLAIAAGILLGRPGRGSRSGPRTAALALAMVGLVAARLWDVASELALASTKEPLARALALQHGRGTFCTGPGDALLASNFAYVFRIACGAPVYSSWPPDLTAVATRAVQPVPLVARLQELAAEAPGRALVVVGVFPGYLGVRRNDLPVTDAQLRALAGSGYVVRRNDARALIAERPGH